MSDLKKAAQQALEALEFMADEWGFTQKANRPERWQAIDALRAALKQPEQKAEPVAWMDPNRGEVCRAHWLESHAPERDVDRFSCPLYTHPSRREWRGLKEWEINDGLDQLPTEDVCSWSFRKGVYFAEAALKERNA
jgi:hypothetical protein